MYLLSNHEFNPRQVVPRLLWIVDRLPELKSALAAGRARLGGIDTWLIWRLSKGASFITDASFASSTGLFDTSSLRWSGFMRNVFSLPASFLPNVCDSCGDQLASLTIPLQYGDLTLPLAALCADQQVSMYSYVKHFRKESLALPTHDKPKPLAKITLGTGSFLNVDTGKSLMYDRKLGVYPLVGWHMPGLSDKYELQAEAGLPPLGALMDWAFEHFLPLTIDQMPPDWANAPLFLPESRQFVDERATEPVELNTIDSSVAAWSVLEGAAFMLADRLDQLKATGLLNGCDVIR